MAAVFASAVPRESSAIWDSVVAADRSKRARGIPPPPSPRVREEPPERSAMHAKLIWAVFLAISGFFLTIEHDVHLEQTVSYLPWLLLPSLELAACIIAIPDWREAVVRVNNPDRRTM